MDYNEIESTMDREEVRRTRRRYNEEETAQQLQMIKDNCRILVRNAIIERERIKQAYLQMREKRIEIEENTRKLKHLCILLRGNMNQISEALKVMTRRIEDLKETAVQVVKQTYVLIKMEYKESDLKDK